ncbi:hypothetical protein HJC23_008807 [Cyclotella cryptica]|uniref:Voltage-gated hydrogen channel 1 n=1 Tax=Cyclotella cryptica TaxID=29204 RepID=A0ABD3PSB7_9STRA
MPPPVPTMPPSPASLENAAIRARPRRTKQTSLGLPTSREEFFYAKEKHGTDDDEIDPWQIRLLAFLNSTGVQHFLIALLMLDVTILFMELAIDAFFPQCYIIESHAISCCPARADNPHSIAMAFSRVLSSDDEHNELCEAPLVETNYPVGCNDHAYPAVHVAHNVLFSLTMIILVTFEIELLIMIYLIGVKKFFSRVFYVVDLFIVTVSLVLEVVFRLLHNEIASDLVGILIFFRVWRFVRIGHGFIASTFELQEEKMEKWKEYIHEVEKIVGDLGGKLPETRPSSLLEEEDGSD